MREAKENEDDEKKEDEYGRWDKRSRMMMKVILKLIKDRDNNIFIAFIMPIIIMSFHY